MVYVTLVNNYLISEYYSHSIVDGGFDEISYTTRLILGTSLMIRDETFSNIS